MVRIFKIQHGIGALFLSKNAARLITALFFLSLGSCQSEEPLNYKKNELVNYLTDLSLMDAVLDYYPLAAKDSISNILKSNIIRRRELDSMKLSEDVQRITSDPELSEFYFERVKENLDSLRSL